MTNDVRSTVRPPYLHRNWVAAKVDWWLAVSIRSRLELPTGAVVRASVRNTLLEYLTQ